MVVAIFDIHMKETRGDQLIYKISIEIEWLGDFHYTRPKKLNSV